VRRVVLLSFLYWVFDHSCGSEADSGYVGVSESPHDRLQSLRHKGTVPQNAEQRILFEGTREECLARERELRPRRKIGWNRGVGGTANVKIKHGLRPIDAAERIRNIWGK
jgi:hypothetical protein